MKNIHNVYKPIGLTPHQLVIKFKQKFPKYNNKKIAYAGRLDPLAHGVMLLLIEPETKKASKYQNLDKEYEFEVLFGVETDTHDVLGIPKNYIHLAGSDPSRSSYNISQQILREPLKKLFGKHKQPYPPYSSATYKGKPLYWWARQKRIKEVKIPNKDIEIYTTDLIRTYKIEKTKLRNLIIKRIKLVKGDFRQEKILKAWEKYFEESKRKSFQIARIKIKCSSGTYVRSIAHNLGKSLGTCALALEIKRTKVGNYSLKNSVRLIL